MNNPLIVRRQKTVDILTGLCPALQVLPEHRSISSRYFCCLQMKYCTCIENMTGTCVAGTWKQLSFLTEIEQLRQDKHDELLREVQNVISQKQ